MPKVKIWAEISEERLRDYRGEAERQGVEVETLIEQTVNDMLEEREQELRDGTDIDIIPS